MLYAEARRAARRTAGGDYVPLDEQSVEAWDAAMIAQAEAVLLRASAMGRVGRFQLEAAVQSAHVIRRRTGRSDWPAIVRLYDALAALTGSPVVAINRAVALAETSGAATALRQLDALADDPRLVAYQPVPGRPSGFAGRGGDDGRGKNSLSARDRPGGRSSSSPLPVQTAQRPGVSPGERCSPGLRPYFPLAWSPLPAKPSGSP